MFKMNFFKKLNPFNRKQKQEPEVANIEVIKKEQKRIISRRKRIGWKPERTSKFRTVGHPWWVKIGLKSKPKNNALHVMRYFGTFSKLRAFRVNGRELKAL